MMDQSYRDPGQWSEAELSERRFYRRAVDAAIWGMPIVSFEAMRRAFLSHGTYGDVLYYGRRPDWRFQVTSPTSSNYYVYFNLNCRAGPVVFEVPAAEGAGLFGSINDAWQAPLVDVGPEGADEGRGARYLLLPPGYEGDEPDGYIVVRSSTYNAYSILRAIAEGSTVTCPPPVPRSL